METSQWHISNAPIFVACVVLVLVLVPLGDDKIRS